MQTLVIFASEILGSYLYEPKLESAAWKASIVAMLIAGYDIILS